MADIALAMFWHQHQPYYPDDVEGKNPMPWVRLHGVKDYYGMALHLLEYPEMQCTINLVPSLLVQLQAYTERAATDQFLTVSRIPADALTEEDSVFLLDHFFMANRDYMIRPFARYSELFDRRAPERNTAREALRRFQARDLRDLQVWFNLAWIHPLAVERDAELRRLCEKGRNFAEAEKTWILEKQLEILRQIVPMHLELARRGQVELTTTPFFHPILPLLLDKKLAREAMPEVRLPRYTLGYPEDAQLQVRRAVEAHRNVFGSAPRGMWPAEGSVCQSMLPLLAEHGIEWIATDEEILAHSTHGLVGRDARGHVRNPDHMYRPYRVGDNNQPLGIVFRDHALSDLIGFHYQRYDQVGAADDFVAKLRAIGEAIPANEPALVTVILDGENCWEHYPGGGVSFLRNLYRRCTTQPGVRPVRIGQFLQDHPPRAVLPHLFAGSWISHNFAIWIGHDEDNTAWDALHRAREHLKQRCSEFGIALPMSDDDAARATTGNDLVGRARRAWDEIYIAEGSDWYWWFGDDHSSAQDSLFDALFRKHLQNVYLLLGDTPPPDLARPISRRVRRPIHTLPRAFLDVKVDGRQTFFEWFSAGRYQCQNERGTMAMAGAGPINDLYFGFDLNNLFIRVDFSAPAREVVAKQMVLRVGFVEPPEWEVLVRRPDERGCQTQIVRQGTAVAAPDVEAACENILEIGVPFKTIGVQPDAAIQFFVELLEDRQSRDRAPREGTIALTSPTPDFEQFLWDV